MEANCNRGLRVENFVLAYPYPSSSCGFDKNGAQTKAHCLYTLRPTPVARIHRETTRNYFLITYLRYVLTYIAILATADTYFRTKFTLDRRKARKTRGAMLSDALIAARRNRIQNGRAIHVVAFLQRRHLYTYKLVRSVH